MRVIGYIVPGIIANEALSQGVVPTLTTTLLIAGLAITRKHLVLIDQSEVMVAPYASSTGSGLRIFGQF